MLASLLAIVKIFQLDEAHWSGKVTLVTMNYQTGCLTVYDFADVPFISKKYVKSGESSDYNAALAHSQSGAKKGSSPTCCILVDISKLHD